MLCVGAGSHQPARPDRAGQRIISSRGGNRNPHRRGGTTARITRWSTWKRTATGRFGMVALPTTTFVDRSTPDSAIAANFHNATIASRIPPGQRGDRRAGRRRVAKASGRRVRAAHLNADAARPHDGTQNGSINNGDPHRLEPGPATWSRALSAAPIAHRRVQLHTHRRAGEKRPSRRGPARATLDHLRERDLRPHHRRDKLRISKLTLSPVKSSDPMLLHGYVKRLMADAAMD